MTRGSPTYDPAAAIGYPPFVDGREHCATVDPEIFFPGRGQDSASAVAVCAWCPHRRPCAAWALETRQAFGIWGGMTAHQRYTILKGGTR